MAGAGSVGVLEGLLGKAVTHGCLHIECPLAHWLNLVNRINISSLSSMFSSIVVRMSRPLTHPRRVAQNRKSSPQRPRRRSRRAGPVTPAPGPSLTWGRCQAPGGHGRIVFGSARRRSATIARNSTSPASVKNSRGRRSLVSSRISPRSTSDRATGGTFGLPASGPPRHSLELEAFGHGWQRREEHVEFTANIIPLAR